MEQKKSTKYILIAISVLFIFVMLILPLFSILFSALKEGFAFYIQAVTTEYVRSALLVTLLATVIAVIVNTFFGIMAAWLLTKFSFRGKQVLATLIDIPFSISPVIVGLAFLMTFGRLGWTYPAIRAINQFFGTNIRITFALPGVVLATIFVTFPFVSREIIPILNAQGKDEEEAAALMGAGGFTIFDVKKGEMISIVGKNGAGKTTLSNLICGFLEPSKGKIELNGNDISPLSVKERGEHIGIVMQNPNQMISKPMIYEEVALGLTVRGVPEEEIRERVHETLKICGLYQFRNWPVSALSFGQKKRVTIASILVMKPEILILDEPTAGQDYRHYTEIMEFLKTINETQGTTIIMITHDMHLMLEYTNRAIVVADGQLLTIDTPAKVLTDETITAPAYLKQTSLYEMAVKCGIEDPSQFVQRFINYERAVR